MVAIGPRAAGYKTPPVGLRQLHLLAVTIARITCDDLSHVRINTADNKTRRLTLVLLSLAVPLSSALSSVMVGVGTILSCQ